MAYAPLANEIGAVYTLTSADGLSVAVFNDPTSPNYVGALTEVTGLDSAEVRESASELIEADGGAHGSFYLGRRPIVLNGKVFGHSSIAERNARLDRARRASLALRGDSNLVWTPTNALIEGVGLRTNWVPNPSAEYDATQVTTTAGGSQPITRQTSQSLYGSASFRVVGDGTVANQGLRTLASPGDIAAPPIPAVQGETWTASVWIKATSGTSNVELLLQERNAGGSALINGVTNAALTNGWQRLSITRTLTDATTAQIVIQLRVSSATAQTWFADGFLVEKSPTAGDFFDGSLPGGAWLGTRGASPSQNSIEVFVPVRRQQPFRETGPWVKDFQMPLVSEKATIQSTYLRTVATGVTTENMGNWPAFPTLEITGTAVNPTVTCDGRVFRTTGLTLASGEKVVFDMLTHTGVFTVGARAGQSANQYINWATTEWPYLAGQGTTQSFSTGGGGTVTASYRHTWA